MIYLDYTTESQTVRIPASAAKIDGTIVLSLINTINRGSAVVDEFDPHGAYLLASDGDYIRDADGLYVLVSTAYNFDESSRLYYVIQVALPESLPKGEYEYTATVGDEIVSEGLAIVGEMEASVTEYENTISYEQYKQ